MEQASDNVVSREPAPKKSVSGWVSVAAVLFFAAVLLYALWPQLAAPPANPGGAAPDFKIPRYSGGEMSLAGLRGSVVVVNFWASWCGPCRYEAPTLEQLWQEYQGKGVQFIGVDIQDTPEGAKGFIDEFHITYPNGPDPNNVTGRAYRITGVPETYLVGKDGRLAKQFIGPVDKAAFEAAVDDLIKEGAAT
jgi:cytochrome c biogenesis protein CcmG, thiol:disulfide interchange protein DsbE